MQKDFHHLISKTHGMDHGVGFDVVSLRFEVGEKDRSVLERSCGDPMIWDVDSFRSDGLIFVAVHLDRMDFHHCDDQIDSALVCE